MLRIPALSHSYYVLHPTLVWTGDTVKPNPVLPSPIWVATSSTYQHNRLFRHYLRRRKACDKTHKTCLNQLNLFSFSICSKRLDFRPGTLRVPCMLLTKSSHHTTNSSVLKYLKSWHVFCRQLPSLWAAGPHHDWCVNWIFDRPLMPEMPRIS